MAPTGTNAPIWSRLVAPTGTKGLVLARCGGMFSPTSLAERAQHLFISCVAAQVLSSSLICRHYTCLPLSLPCWAYWACEPASWPMCRWVSSRMQAVWPIRWHFFIFFLVFFCFLNYLFSFDFCFIFLSFLLLAQNNYKLSVNPLVSKFE